ncbi:hypothetical protein A2630_00980 [Candidatus Woesebacteria bacterium RIFCSPHIGHO2_01_FULL_44_10]|uniref:VIT family protein n=1 Tax=Candidatus Woesebacteria bacterium RIFCSPLOWO2_01_FULL_44_14 TaxID=1802525 RepID=A0A1F8C1J8_9BACT|nr:MAG: hypothetical protein A2630_00980 [Candidatus Woesebacteria bacterium RIFCSPHIGHO2_01_FULL_44_10]OGM54116.1 MAG: hypothetical protein A3F62_05425 [Candidatus Woesebacteria bacterium RIFCSPHIGHO2_12_FULL_44_11]OGM70207.1 MAG: hypothetical protein A2975_03995 [Candidatus Woesebacteria bacterium RIFCSPLOWO2_01_FULL_44_14]
MNTKQATALYTKNFIFGVEDSLVSTVGLLSGVAAAGMAKHTIFLTGVILIFVEAFSMGVGSFLAEQSVEEYEESDKVAPTKSIISGLIMFASYFASGFIPLFPYVVFEVSTAFWTAITLTLTALFLLGIISASRFHHKDLFRHGIRMLLVGGLAIVAGVAVGKIIA